MRFIIKRFLKKDIPWLMRGTGYRFQRKDKETGEWVFVKALARGGYPRFHLYVKIKEGKLIFNLHLDQKRPIYKGTTAHSAEYEGEVVEEEAKRLKEALAK